MEKVLLLEKNLNSYLKASLNHASFDEMSLWVNDTLFKNNFIKENLALNFLWIFSQARILPSDKVVTGTCSWLYINLQIQSDIGLTNLAPEMQAVALEKLCKHINRLPSIQACLTNTERAEVKEILKTLEMDDRILNFSNSEQFIQLQKLHSIPIVNSFLSNYERLLDIATNVHSDQSSVSSILQYIMKTNDVVRDSVGVLGLVDDLYALEQLSVPIDENKLEDIKWLFETSFPDFQYPIIVDQAGNNLLHKVDDLIKASLIYSDNYALDRKLFFLEEPGPFALLTSMLGMIAELKIDNQVSYVRNRDTLIKGNKYKFNKGSQFVVLKFEDIYPRGSQDIYMFSTSDAGPRMLPSKLIEQSVIQESDEDLSRDYQLDFFKHIFEVRLSGMFPFGLASNMSISFHKTVLVDKKKNIDYYLKTKIEDRTIEEWFGCRKINTKGKIEEIIGDLSDEPLITIAYDIKSLVGFLINNKLEEASYHSANIVFSKSVDNEIEELSILSGIKGSAFKTINCFASEENDYFKSQFLNLGYKIFNEKRSSNTPYVCPPNDDLFENYLSKIGAYPQVIFLPNNEPKLEEFYNLLNFSLGKEHVRLKPLLFSIKRIFLQRFSPLTSSAKEALLIKMKNILARLKSYIHINENIPLIIDFLQNNQDLLLNYQKFSITSGKKLDDRNKVLLKIKQLADLKRKYPAEHYISPTELLELKQLDSLIVPAYTDRRLTRSLINFPYAEKIIFIASEFEIDNYLQPLLNQRDQIKASKTPPPKEEEMILPFEKEFLMLEVAGFQDHSYGANHSQLESVECKILILEDSKFYFVPRGGKIIVTHDEINLDPIEFSVADVEQGDFLILPDTNHGDLQDSILDLTKKNIHEIRSKAFMWKKELQDAIKLNKFSLEDLESMLAKNGESRKLLTIKNWFKDPHLIAPQHPDKVFKVFASILEREEGHFDESLDNVATLYKARKKVMDDLPSYLKAGTFEDNTNTLNMDINGKLFKASLYEVLGSENAKTSPEDLYKLRELDT